MKKLVIQQNEHVKKILLAVLTAVLLPSAAFGEDYFQPGMKWVNEIYSPFLLPGARETTEILCEAEDPIYENVYLMQSKERMAFDPEFNVDLPFEGEQEIDGISLHVRRDGDRIYFRLPDDPADKWYLMYDFGLKVGEHCIIGSPSGVQQYGDAYLRQVVCISRHRDEGKHYGLSYMKMGILNDSGSLESSYEWDWIVDIGSEFGITHNIHPGEGGGYQLIEASLDDVILYSIPASVSGLEESALHIGVREGELHINALEAGYPVEVYDISGVRMAIFNPDQLSTGISYSLPGKGVYIVRCGSESRRLIAR